ncbi:MAG: IS1 family transposase, partial [Alphaproteobacteria bacterium]|nr:IS1 family transposase [Alphaproteobacteria bacterium]
MQISCKDCGSYKLVRNGKARKNQRYKCKDCALSFIEGDRRQKSPVEA